MTIYPRRFKFLKLLAGDYFKSVCNAILTGGRLRLARDPGVDAIGQQLSVFVPPSPGFGQADVEVHTYPHCRQRGCGQAFKRSRVLRDQIDAALAWAVG